MPKMTPNEQFQALNLLDYLIDLFTASPRVTIPRTDVIKVLRATRQDSDFFDAEIIELQQAATIHVNPLSPTLSS